MKYISISITPLFLLTAFSASDIMADGIHITKVKCSQIHCKYAEYCREIDSTCQPCSGVCNSSTHNFDPTLCEKDCQDYIHDGRYMLKDDNLKEIVQRLSNLLNVTLTLVCLILVTLGALLCMQLYRWKKKKNITIKSIRNKFFSKKTDPDTKKDQPQGENIKPDLRLEIPSSDTHSDNSPVTMTTSISRRPAEDTLEYAYDNPAMANSPNGSTKPHERTF